MKRIERNWEKEFPGCGESVRELVREMGFIPVYPKPMKVGMRVELVEDTARFPRGKKAIIIGWDEDNPNAMKVAFDYYSEEPIIVVVLKKLFKTCIN